MIRDALARPAFPVPTLRPIPLKAQHGATIFSCLPLVAPKSELKITYEKSLCPHLVALLRAPQNDVPAPRCECASAHHPNNG